MYPHATNDERIEAQRLKEKLTRPEPAFPTGIVDRAVIVPIKGEKDPLGRDQHSPGAKVDAGKPRYALVLSGFAYALQAVTRVGTLGAAKYSDFGFLQVPNGFERYEDAQLRHQFARHRGEMLDPESHELHLTHEAWNALAKLELYLRAQKTK